MRTLRADEVAELLDEESGLPKVNAWLARGDGVAVYRNEDMSSRSLGNHKFVSFGSPDATFPTEPPQQLPDSAATDTSPAEINWRFQLYGVYRGRQLEPASTHDYVLPPVVLPLVLNCFENRDLLTVDNRLIAYTLEVGYQPDGAANFNMFIRAKYTPSIDGECAEIRLTAPTHHDGMVDRLGPWSWYIRNMKLAQSNLVDGTPLTGSDPNLGGAIVSICNLSTKKPGEGE